MINSSTRGSNVTPDFPKLFKDIRTLFHSRALGLRIEGKVQAARLLVGAGHETEFLKFVESLPRQLSLRDICFLPARSMEAKGENSLPVNVGIGVGQGMTWTEFSVAIRDNNWGRSETPEAYLEGLRTNSSLLSETITFDAGIAYDSPSQRESMHGYDQLAEDEQTLFYCVLKQRLTTIERAIAKGLSLAPGDQSLRRVEQDDGFKSQRQQ
ncbi:hypothetical protein A2230_06815 [candidate division WOR-1 bacterium RIFOXYA2_FULL_36_21]|uniref:Uncharacterized protein n=1 Tax=candidate division WOR-1 bacterium RIFOXYB2_FULL_36_35 TaxID=1802578 RepID=A0A1F4S369_UNCSA|nr:MAG: hypothetical protein A2230_06815 [candidate division WOR-1 bacterium RIFOXYA2_FULL_36_21]OGC14858.1 MAG: hypothetical protein A2290_01010 [candidate division WOR-1 bacterium RIFOXYB2_FULL_36_35]